MSAAFQYCTMKADFRYRHRMCLLWQNIYIFRGVIYMGKMTLVDRTIQPFPDFRGAVWGVNGNKQNKKIPIEKFIIISLLIHF